MSRGHKGESFRPSSEEPDIDRPVKDIHIIGSNSPDGKPPSYEDSKGRSDEEHLIHASEPDKELEMKKQIQERADAEALERKRKETAEIQS